MVISAQIKGYASRIRGNGFERVITVFIVHLYALHIRSLRIGNDEYHFIVILLAVEKRGKLVLFFYRGIDGGKIYAQPYGGYENEYYYHPQLLLQCGLFTA